MKRAEIRDRYFALLKAHVAKPEEKHLAAVAELGRELVLADVPPEEIAELHEQAIHRLAEECPDMVLVEAARLISAPLMELLMAYGLAFRERLEGRRRAEEALRESEEKYRTMFQTAPVSIWQEDFSELKAAIDRLKAQGVTDFRKYLDEHPDFLRAAAQMVKVLDVNDATLRMYGAKSKAELPRSLDKVFAPESYRGFREELIAIAEGKAAFEMEMVTQTLQGERLDVIVRLKIPSETSKFTHLLVSVLDMTERKRAEERYRTLFEESRDVVFMSTPDGRLIDINPAGVTLFGYESREELLKVDILSDIYVNPQDREKLLEGVVEQGYVKDFELMVKRKDGEKLAVLVTATAVRDETGAIVAYRGIMRDVTEQKQLERQLLQAQKLESLGTLVGGIAHDFNNILTGILGYTQLLLRGMSPDGKAYDRVQRIQLLGERAADVVNQLLTFSREELSHKRTINLHPFLKELLGLLKHALSETIKVDMRLADEELMVEADPAQLQQVVMNLVINARDAMPKGGRLRLETARIELDEAYSRVHPDVEPGSYVRLSVSDTGKGIPPEDRERVFDPFFTTKQVGKGTGLGLAVVYGIVKKHGGLVEVQSEMGQGTTVEVTLPAAEGAGAAAAGAMKEMKGGTETILLAEDEAMVLEVGRMALEEFGYRVLTAQNGEEALAVYREQGDEIALVILDVVMPKMGGREALRALQRLNPDVKVLLTTGYGADQLSGDELAGVGACGLLRKPFQIQELARTVRAVLDLKPGGNVIK